MTEKRKIDTPPYDQDAEKAVLGILLCHSGELDTLYGHVSPGDFLERRHQRIFQEILNLSDRSEDPELIIPNLIKELEHQDKELFEKWGGRKYIAELASVPEITNRAGVLFYAKIIRDCSIKRIVADTGREMVADAYSNRKDAQEIVGKASERISNLQQAGIPKEEIKPYGMQELETELRQSPKGLKTGIDTLDELIRIPQEAITIIAGRPSHGKTTLLMSLLLNMIRQYPDKTFAFFSYEETRKQIAVKLIDNLGGTPLYEQGNSREQIPNLEKYIQDKGNELPEIQGAKPDIDKAIEAFKQFTKGNRLYIIDKAYEVDELYGVLAYLAHKHTLGAVFIDYIQKIKIKSSYGIHRQVELQKISEKILEAARNLKIPILLGAQLGRDPQSKNKVRMDNMRESGDIEQDANLMLGIFNPAVEAQQAGGNGASDTRGKERVPITVAVMKNRNGPVNQIANLWHLPPLYKME